MKRSVTGKGRRWCGRAVGVTATTLLVATGALAGSPSAAAIAPPVVDPGALPPDGPPGPAQPMRQSSYCTEVGVLPGSDFRVQPKYMDMLNLPEAWQFGRGGGVKVAVIDTGVTPHPRLPHLTPGGDYVMAGGDGLSDCDAHGTMVASMIAAAPATGAAAEAPARRPLPVPTNEPPPPPPPPQTITMSVPPPPPQTITMVPAPPPEEAPAQQPALPWLPPPPKAPGAVNRGHGSVTAPSYSGGRRIVVADRTQPREPAPPPPPPAAPDAFNGIAPDVEVISIRQSSQAFTAKEPFGGDEDPQTRQKSDGIRTMARAIVHAANMGASVINISDVTCMSVRNVLDQADLGAAVRYAAVDKDAVIVTAAGDTSKKDCKQNPVFDPLQPNDPRDWNGVNTVVTPSWFSDYVLAVGAVDSSGAPMANMSVAGPWVSIAAPGTDIVGLSPRDNGLVNAVEGPENSLLVPSGTSFSTAIVSGVAALVRAKYPQLSAHQVINRLIRTARAPARGVDNQVGYGIVDPVAALTWDVPDGPVKPPERLSAPLNPPPPPPPRNMTPVWVAAGGLAAALLVAGAVVGGAVLMRRQGRQP
ncbi:type VII secretion-associated serine protease mycosin [Mycobacterium xenopi]|nr:type VII secretion-associated serine protease mycosin [Mycobacterium xenopi]EID14182.1 proline rich membrane-anchored mycosin MycP5 [Mycobacterium xenopi RIVM700367]MDA3640965.1 type VII secretion-associated serine protease mycosin [Mycobacterium xenopi]MDA3660105.1 type VII secretion-associated serine protease mycosin [Mycobacterium xenopi]MDA3664770.1 type VII secretion-associated serine protease mycosin [Mycobacterium xenopi]ORX19543.1 peptidase S8 [Mycobacterium xenopi]